MATHHSTRILFAVLLALALTIGVLSPPVDAQPSTECAVPVPVDEITVGMTGTGLTVTRGTTPESFDAEVLGVLNDGIAPGIDMIIANLQSPAIDEAGVWFGMSGSPVYADDGRLIGAVSFSLSFAPSSIAGLTPAEHMVELYDRPGALSQAVDQQVQLPAAVQRRAAARSYATSSQMREGLAPLPVPVAVSSLRRARYDELEERLSDRADVRLFRASRAPAAAAGPDEIFPGSNFAAALSYGDLTLAGLGTTTDVCNGAALAFGHPFFLEGRTSLSAHGADTIVIAPDAVFGAIKVANPGGVAGTVDQDRTVGVRAQLGDGPDPRVVASNVKSQARNQRRRGETFINRSLDVPFIAPFHVLVNLDRMLDKIGEGRVNLTWTATGTSGDGTPFELRRANRFASRYDASFEAIFEMLDWLFILEENRFTEVEFGDIQVSGTVKEDFQQVRLGSTRVAVNNGSFRKMKNVSRLRVRPGDVIKVRQQLKQFRESTPFRTVELRLTVPQRLSGQSMTLGVFGGASVSGETNPSGGRSFDDILDRMRRAESNNDLLMRLQRGGNGDPRVLKKTERSLVNPVTGRRSVPVTVR